MYWTIYLLHPIWAKKYFKTGNGISKLRLGLLQLLTSIIHITIFNNVGMSAFY